jgi:hypothetical protein
MKKWIFIIDTDSYAGNFERDMCAYITGVVGDCGVGEEFAKMYEEEMNVDEDLENVFVDYLEFRPDDHGCARPCDLWPTKGWLIMGDSKVVRKEDWDQKKADKEWQKCQVKIYEEYKKQTENVTVGQNGWTEKNKAREIANHQKCIDRV